MMGDHIPQRAGGTPEGRQRDPQDSDDEVDGGQLWDAQHQVEYLRLDGEFGGELSPQPSSSAECEHRVSPLDPNLSSAARYSPPPPYSSPVTGIEASLDHPDSPMEDLSHSSSLPIIPTGVSSSISSATGSLVHSESHRLPLPHSSARQVSGSRTSSFVSPNSLFTTRPSLQQAQPRWAAHNEISDVDDDDDDDDDDESDPPALSESVWAKQNRLALRSIVENEASQAGSSGLQSASPTNPSVFMNSPQPGPSGVQAVLQPSSSCMQSRSHPGSSGSRTLPQPSPSNLDALPSSNKVPAQHHGSDSSDGDGDHDSSESLPQLCSTLSSGIRRRIVQLSDGEAEALNGPTSGCEASSSMRGHVTPLSSPSTPADNCIVSSSTGHIDSIPPTPAEFQGNDVSGPCSPVSPSLASVAILDSTVDSTSGREIINTEGQSCDDESDEDNLAASGHIELPVIVDEAEEISTSEVDLQHSDDSQDVALLVNPQGMFASGRASANRFIEHLSLSLSHFPGNSLGPGISGIVNEHRIPTNTLAPSDSGSYLDVPLTTPEPSRAPLPCSSQSASRQAATPAHQSRDHPSISSTHSMPDAVEVLDGNLPLLDIASGLPECSTVSHGGHLSNDAGSQALEEGVARLENESDDMTENEDEIDPLASLADTVNDSVNSDNLAADSGNQDFNQLTPSYVLELPDESSAGSEDVLSSASCDKDELANVNTTKGGYPSPVTSHQSLLEAETVTGDSLDNSLGITLTSSQPRKELESDVPLPGTSQQQNLTQQLITSQASQVSLLVGGSDDSSDGALLMMVAPHPRSLQNIVTQEKPLEKEESSSLLPCLEAASPQNIPCDEEAPPASADSEETNVSKQNQITTTASHKVEAEFIGADFWCGECGHMYTHECPTHRLQDSDKSGRTRAWTSHSGREVIGHKLSDTDGCVDCEQVNNHECPQHHIQAISDKPVQARAWASLPGQHLAIRKIAGTEEFGVFTRKVIPRRTRFGPLEGVMTGDASGILPSNGLIYSVVTGEETIFLDVSDEGSSNWMRFVRKATSYLEQNCVVMQIEGSLVFLTSTDILPRTELRVGYSKQYASQRNLHSLEPTQQEISVLESMRKSWPCYECDEGFESSAELQQHLTCHDEAGGEEERKKRKRLKNRRPRANGDAEAPTKKMVKRIKTFGEEGASAGSSQTAMRGHLHANGEQSLQHHQCKICNRAYVIPELLKIHQHSHQTVEIKEEDDGISLKQESRTCPQCSKIFESEVELLSHVEEHSLCLPVSSKPYKCDFCYKSFLRRDRLEAHTAVHGNEAEKPYRCSLCLRRFCSNSALNTHIKFHIEGSKGYDCPICREGFFSVASLKAHVSTHCVNEQYKCPTCNKVFPTYSKIRRHIRSYHAILPHTCSICSKEMPSIDKLKIHMLSHSDRRDYLCQDCGKRFKRKDKMQEHSKRMHSSDRDGRASKAATKAPPKFVPKVDPTDYMQFEYKCHTCLLGFKRRGMLVNHLAKRHPNVDMNSVPELNQPILKATRCYYCQYCEKMYRSSSKRKLHILKYHPGEELPPSSTTHKESRNGEDSTYSQTVGAVTTYPHPCKWCYRQYASRARLLRHQRHQHPDVNADSPSIKDYGKDLGEPGVSDMDPLLDGAAGITREIPLANQIVEEGNLMRNHQLSNIPRGEPSTSVVQGPEDDLLTQAMGEISPLTSGDQYVRLIGTGAEGQQVMVGTTQANRPLLVSSEGGQQGTTLALVTTDSADTVTLSLPAGQFISLIPGLSVSGPASVVTPDSRAASSGRESAHLDDGEAQEDNRAASQELQGEILSAIRMGPSLSKEESVEQVVLTAHQSPPSSSVVWQQTLSFTNTST